MFNAQIHFASYRGAMAEQFVGQEMLVSQNGSLYYWDRQAKSSSAAVDYLAVMNGKKHPVAVKSGSAGSLRSLHLFTAAYRDCGQAMVFSDRPHADLPEQRITFMPLYSAFAATGGRAKLDDAAGEGVYFFFLSLFVQSRRPV